MDQFEQTKRQIREFTEERDWDKFHNPKDLAIALSIEANELLEAFLWKTPSEAKREKVEEELADVFNYAFLTDALKQTRFFVPRCLFKRTFCGKMDGPAKKEGFCIKK